MRYWDRWEVEAVMANIDELHLYGFNAVACSTNEEVNTLCIALGLAQRWRVSWLGLPHEMSIESWKELKRVVVKGAVDTFHNVHCEMEEEVMKNPWRLREAVP